MLLSHNFDVSPDVVPILDRTGFAEVFQSGLSRYEDLQCQLIDHPHWIVEILFAIAKFSPQQVGELCAQALAERRRTQQPDKAPLLEILILGGLKTTPPTSTAPNALQPGEWGVDVVETQSGEAFLQAIAWADAIAQKPPDSVFKVEFQV
jgi:hypothetical protein